MTTEEHKQSIISGIQQMTLNTLVEQLVKVAAELETANARIKELEKPAEPKKE